jgi:hypothetical protein
MARQGFVNYAWDWGQFPLPGAGMTAYHFSQQAASIMIIGTTAMTQPTFVVLERVLP